ncbi:MAG: hypothetical protein AB8B85_21890 [Paracoccaceae bacterium]
MNMLIEELSLLGQDPKSWIVVAVLAVFALHSAVGVFMCPYVKGTLTFTQQEVETARAHQFRASWRFALLMLGGIVLMLAGLFMIANGVKPSLALALLVTGIVLTQTEPLRLQLREQKFVVIAAQGGSEGSIISAQDRMASNHRVLAFTNAGMLVAVTATLLAF